MPFGYWRCNYRMRGCNPFNVNSDLISLQNGFWLLERTTTKWVLGSFLQDAWVLEIDFLQNDPCQPFYMGLKATHFVVEMGMGIYIRIQADRKQHLFAPSCWHLICFPGSGFALSPFLITALPLHIHIIASDSHVGNGSRMHWCLK